MEELDRCISEAQWLKKRRDYPLKISTVAITSLIPVVNSFHWDAWLGHGDGELVKGECKHNLKNIVEILTVLASTLHGVMHMKGYSARIGALELHAKLVQKHLILANNILQEALSPTLPFSNAQVVKTKRSMAQIDTMLLFSNGSSDIEDFLHTN